MYRELKAYPKSDKYFLGNSFDSPLAVFTIKLFTILKFINSKISLRVKISIIFKSLSTIGIKVIPNCLNRLKAFELSFFVRYLKSFLYIFDIEEYIFVRWKLPSVYHPQIELLKILFSPITKDI